MKFSCLFLSKIKKGNKRVTDVFRERVISASFQSQNWLKLRSNYANGLLHRFVVAAPKGAVHKLGRLKIGIFCPLSTLVILVFLLHVAVYV